MATVSTSDGVPSVNVHILQSSKPLNRIKSDLNKLEEGGYIHVNVIYRRNPNTRVLQPTRDLSMLIASDNFVDKVRNSDMGYKVVEYNWDSFPKPKYADGETDDLHVTGIPNTISWDEANESIYKMIGSLGLNPQNCEIDLKVESRTTGFVTGYGTIKFDESVPLYTRRLCKLVLHNREFDSTSRKFMNCTWHNPTISKSIRSKISTTPSSTETSTPRVQVKSFRSLNSRNNGEYTVSIPSTTDL